MTTRAVTLLSLAALATLGLGVARSAGAQRAAEVAPPLTLQALSGSRVTVRGSTTVGADWHCSATDVAATTTLHGAAGEIDLRDLRAVTVEVPVSALRCQNGPMERAMRSALRADREEARTIVGRFTEMHSEGATGRAHLDGTLRVAGEERRVALCAVLEPRPDGAFLVRSTLPLTMTHFGVTPPRVLLGAVRSRDAFAVEVELIFRPTAVTSARTAHR